MDQQELSASLGSNLKKTRKAAKLSQTEAAKLAGITQPHYSQLERGTRNPRLETLKAVSEAFGITMNDLVCENEIPPETLATVTPQFASGVPKVPSMVLAAMETALAAKQCAELLHLPAPLVEETEARVVSRMMAPGIAAPKETAPAR